MFAWSKVVHMLNEFMANIWHPSPVHTSIIDVIQHCSGIKYAMELFECVVQISSLYQEQNGEPIRTDVWKQ